MILNKVIIIRSTLSEGLKAVLSSLAFAYFKILTLGKMEMRFALACEKLFPLHKCEGLVLSYFWWINFSFPVFSSPTRSFFLHLFSAQFSFN